ncbi:MAG: hypothetical protein AAB442_02780 [Patescibacteria group bacterium]
MNEQFWRSAPKQFADDTNVAVMRGNAGKTILLAILSGANAQVFAFTPEHMKRFSQLIAYNVGEYEKTDGEIKVEDWTPGMKSPFSVEDFQSGSDDAKTGEK